MRISNERGIAMITTLLVLMLISALLVGFTTMVVSDQRFRFIDRDRGQAFYAASGGVEKLTTDLGNTFLSNVAPTGTQVAALVQTTSVPAITGVTYTSATTPAPLPGSSLNSCPTWPPKTIGANGYNLTFCADAAGNPTNIASNTILVGPYAGLTALQTPYQIDVTAKTSTGGEVHLSRTIEASAIPVFQFGTFSDVDLSFFAGADFNFGGRVHTNGNLFLAHGGGTLTLSGKVTAVKEVIRQRLQNGQSIDTSPTHTATVNMASSSTSFRSLARTEGSVVDGVGSAINDPVWQNVSLSSYNSWIRNGRTGAKALNLPLLTVGGTNPDLIRRPPVGENTSNPVLYNERLFSKASIRILLSDTAADITNLPTVTATAPILLDGDWKTTPPSGITVDASHLPIARSLGSATAFTTADILLGATSFTVNAVPAIFENPNGVVGPILSAKSGGTTESGGTLRGAVNQIKCTARTDNTFSGCTVGTSLNSGDTIFISAGSPTTTAASGSLSGAPLLTHPTATVNSSGVSNGTNRVITLVSGQSTQAFAANTFWLNDTGSGGKGFSVLVTCTGLSGTTFSGCSTTYPDMSSGSPATPTGKLPLIKSGATLTTSYASNQGTGVIGGYLKVERQDTNGVWTDVTQEILNYGFSAPNVTGFLCNDPTPNAILRIQRLRDNGGAPRCPTDLGAGNTNVKTTNSYEYWPQTLFDTREGLVRDTAPIDATLPNPDVPLGGVMHYIAIDVTNLAKYFTATGPYAAGTGAGARKDNGGFTVYFSDRRNNRKADNTESGEYGWEDIVNPNNAASGTANGILDTGEDVNANGLLDTYGKTPNYNGTSNAVPPGALAPLTASALPSTMIKGGVAQVNRSILFRHALKLINARDIRGLGVTGLTVVAENPVYVQGDWNAKDGGSVDFNGTSAATAVIADAVTLLSNEWDDPTSYTFPYKMDWRARTSQSWYRLAIIGGKNPAFPWINYTGAPTDFGTDGGAHNFLRFLEDGGGSGQAVNYMGATATFFYSRQAVGTFKCCTTVYGAPTRNFAFDNNFNNPALLPPNTPVFRDMNAVGFSQELRPGK